MPTLRNKTTGKGTIVRWKPHPDHARPSTYQVTPRALAFFKQLGYTVPSPGDEATIPPQVCRPLRLLGDLYFESEAQNDIEFGRPPSKDYYRSSGLTDEELGQLRAYVESHPSFVGGFRTELEEEIDELPGTHTRTPQPALDPDARSIRRLSNGEVLLPTPFYLGRIDRRSNNGNAMLVTASGKEVNLGRLPSSVVGEWTIGVGYRGDWTMCLVPHQWTPNYRDSVNEYLDQLGDLTGLESLLSILHIQRRDYGIDIDGAELNVRVCFAGHGVAVAYHGEWTILIDSELATAGQRIHVEVQAVYGNIGLAVPRRPSGTAALTSGDRVRMTIDSVGKNLLVGTHNEQIVTVPRQSDVIPDSIVVAVTDVTDGYVTGTVDALPETDRPAVGEAPIIQHGRFTDYPDIPVEIPETTLPAPFRVRLPVNTIQTDAVSVSAMVYEKQELYREGDRITSASQQWGNRGLVITADDVPVVVTGGRYVPGITVQAKVGNYTDGFVEAGFEQFVLQNDIQSAEEGTKLGNRALRASQFDAALQAFTASVEHTDKATHPEQWLAAALNEIIAVVARTLAQRDIQEAIRYVEIRHETLTTESTTDNHFPAPALDELHALQQILEAKNLLEKVQHTENKPAGAEARRDAKALVEDATTRLAALPPLNGQERPHWLIIDELQTVTDELLLVPSSVKKYLANYRQTHMD